MTSLYSVRKSEDEQCQLIRDLSDTCACVAVKTERYEAVADNVCVNVGGFVTDDIDPCAYDYIMTCGPEIMMKVLYKKCVAVGATAPVYVSMENRMACGIGACLVCTCKTNGGNKRACKDGPVMLGSEVFGDE